jgi:hypothetical protein
MCAEEGLKEFVDFYSHASVSAECKAAIARPAGAGFLRAGAASQVKENPAPAQAGSGTEAAYLRIDAVPHIRALRAAPRSVIICR